MHATGLTHRPSYLYTPGKQPLPVLALQQHRHCVLYRCQCGVGHGQMQRDQAVRVVACRSTTCWKSPRITASARSSSGRKNRESHSQSATSANNQHLSGSPAACIHHAAHTVDSRGISWQCCRMPGSDVCTPDSRARLFALSASICPLIATTPKLVLGVVTWSVYADTL